ncbi:MAG: hypothetical protein SGARI_001815 [Bacillariaceae sp.]
MTVLHPSNSETVVEQYHDNDNNPQPLQPERHHIRRTSVSSTLTGSLLKKFSCSVSTEDYHTEYDREAVYGPFAHLRRLLLNDLEGSCSYQNYTLQRQWLQDAIIEDFLDNVEDDSLCITPTEPWLIFTVGARGAGKNHTLHELVQTGKLPILSFVHVDPDSLRRRLPEFEAYAKCSPDLVNNLMRKESSFLAELLLLAALQNGRNAGS